VYYVFISVLTFFILGLPLSTLLFFKDGNQKSILEIFILTSITGPLIVNYLIFTLGYAGLLSRENVLLATCAVILVPFLSKNVRSSMRKFCFLFYEHTCQLKKNLGKMKPLKAFPLGVMLSILAITSYSAFTLSPVLRDPYAVWLFYGKKIMETRTIPLFYGNAPDISWSGNYPPLNSFLAGYYFIILGQAVSQAFTHVSWLYGALVLLATYLLTNELGLGKVTLISASLLTTSSLFTLELINFGYVTIAWSFYVITTCFYLVKLLRERNMRASLPFGLSLGAALLSTYLSFIFLASIVALLIAKAIVKRVNRQKLHLKRSKPLIVGFIIAFALLAPWLVRNYMLLQNPLYPWFYELFGGKGIDSAIIMKIPQPKYSLDQLFTENTSTAKGNEDIGYVLLIFGLIGSLYLIWRREKLLADVRWLTLTFFMFSLFSMSLYYGYERYLLMVAPLLAVSAGYLCNSIFSSKMKSLKILALASILLLSLPSYYYLITLAPYGAPVGETEQLNIIEHYIDAYLSSDAVILTNEIQLYFINRKAINVYNLPEVFQAKNLTELTNSLKVNNISHVLINARTDTEVLENTILFSALNSNSTFEVLMNMSPFTLYEVNYGESFGYG
jgi:hypothetical protein